MSALTDLFTSFANKIRSKVGGSQTYTPLEMIDAIDDVYDAGAASVPTPTPITPSNSSPVALTANTPVTPTASGYAIASYSNVTPSNSTPVSLSANSPVIPASSGYAIESYQSKTPSADGVSFNSGIVKMSSSGYAYSGQVTLKATTLWTNNSPTSSFSSQAVTLSQDVDNFAYIGIRYKASTSSSAETNEYFVSTADYKKSQSGNSHVRLVIAATNSNGNVYLRATYYVGDTSLNIGDAYRMNNNAGASNTLIIPTSIVGYKIQA